MQAHLRALDGQPWPQCYLGCTREEVLEYASMCSEIAELTGLLQEAILGTKAAQSALVAGRLVQLQNRKTGLPEVKLPRLSETHNAVLSYHWMKKLS
jgi:antiviral helicase SKI2